MSKLHRSGVWFVFGFLCFISSGTYAANKKPIIDSSSPKIIWQKWGAEAFNQAKRENKMVLLDVGIEVCFACRWMEEYTYRDPQVIKMVMKNFIPIQVDADDQPDIGERYSDWAWPATIFMAPDGTQVLGLRGNRQPPNFIPILEKLISQHAIGQLKPDLLAPYAAPSAPVKTDLTAIRDKVRFQLDDDFDDKLGGWGDELKEIDGSGNMVQLAYRAHADGDSKSEQRFMKTAYAMLDRLDPVWGGFYAAGTDGWKLPIPEKRTGAQATALEVFSYAYHLKKDKRFLQAAKEVDRYLRDWMLAADGTFYTSQKDMPSDLPKNWTTQQYFNLDSDARRRQFGVPPIDHAVYTDLNARVIVAYTKLYEATGDSVYLQTAENAAKTLITQRQQAAGWVLHASASTTSNADERIHIKSTKARPYLRTQVNFGVALLSLYKVTGEQSWLDSAKKLASALVQKLEDPKLGGFYASAAEGSEATSVRRKPLQDNGVAARFLFQLGKYTKDKALIASAERAIRAASDPTMLQREGRIIGDLAVALETVTSDYVEFTVVGDRTLLQSQQLFNIGRQYYEPRKLLHYEKPGRYPDFGRPVMFICSQDACSVPIFEVKDVAIQAEKFKRVIDVTKTSAKSVL